MPNRSPNNFASSKGKHDTTIIGKKEEALPVSQPRGIMFRASGACLTWLVKDMNLNRLKHKL